jgi:prevent-host-death family protein
LKNDANGTLCQRRDAQGSERLVSTFWQSKCLKMVRSVVHFERREGHMQVTVTEAKARLTELVKRAEDGEQIVLTRHGHDIVRLVAVRRATGVQDRRSIIAQSRASAARKDPAGSSAARSQDVLYDDDGLPS